VRFDDFARIERRIPTNIARLVKDSWVTAILG
jgi:hypothetical protein